MLPPHLGSPVSLLPQRQDCPRSSLFSYLTWSATLPGSSPRFLHSLLKSASGCIDIAPTGHTLSHTPHPLQKSMFIHLSFSVRLYRASGHCSQHFGQDMHLFRSRMGHAHHRPVSTSLADAPHAIVRGGLLPALRLAHASTASSRPRRMALQLAQARDGKLLHFSCKVIGDGFCRNVCKEVRALRGGAFGLFCPSSPSVILSRRLQGLASVKASFCWSACASSGIRDIRHRARSLRTDPELATMVGSTMTTMFGFSTLQRRRMEYPTLLYAHRSTLTFCPYSGMPGMLALFKRTSASIADALLRLPATSCHLTSVFSSFRFHNYPPSILCFKSTNHKSCRKTKNGALQ